MNFKSIIYSLFACLSMAFLYSCADDMQIVYGDDNYSIINGDKVEVHLTVNLDNSGNERTRDDSNDGSRNPDYSNPGIGGGTLASTLIYQLYDQEGNPVALPNPDTSSDIIGLHQVRVENRQFPYSDIVFTVDNGKEYTMIFWAQSGEESAGISDYPTKGDWFYETDDLKNIIVRYDSQDKAGQGQLNNTDSRDAFCARIKFTGGKPLPDITLRRVMAQINIGFTEVLWKKLQNSNVDIQKSSIWIANVGRRFNLFEDKVELFSSGKETESQEDLPEAMDGTDETGKGGITWPFTMGAYNINTIPAYMEYPGRKENGENMLNLRDGNYHWVSMCYILAPGETEEYWDNGVSKPIDIGSTVDIVNMQFYDKNGVAYNLPLTELLNVPVKRNYRTNILVDELFSAKVTMDAQIGPDTYDDFGVDSEGINEGELTPGLTYRVSTIPSHWSNAPGFEFYVSSMQGLKWLADRSNGLDFKMKDIPEWMIKKEGWDKLSNNKEILKAYETKVFDLFFNQNRALLYHANERSFAERNKYGFRMPITFDDCIIYLTNDLDFNEAPDYIKNDWHGFSCNMSYYNDEGSNLAVWFMTASDNKNKYIEPSTNPNNFFQYSNSQTNYNHGFKGIFDGQGYTIYNMVINNLNDFYEKSEMDEKTYGPRKLHNAGFICTAGAYAEIKNLRLYNAYIKGDYNIGGFVGYMNGEQPLIISNCRFVNSRIEGAEPERYSPSDDANVGGIGGSLQSIYTIENCQVVNSDIISTFIGGAFVGIPGGSPNFSNNKVYDTNVILTELNNVGTINGSVKRTAWSIGATEDASFFFGTNNYSDISSFNTGSAGDCSINAFYGIKYSPVGSHAGGGTQSANEGAYGRSTVKNVPLELFPDILTKYAQCVTLDSHIIGKARDNGGVNYGIKIDISGQPDEHGVLITNTNDTEGTTKNIIDNNGNEWYFTLTGTTYESNPLDGQSVLGEKYSRQHVLLVSPSGLNDVKGVYVCAPTISTNAVRHVTIKDVIIAGEPSIEYGLYLDNVKDMKLDHVAIYDVKNAFGDENVPSGASFSTNECDFRGITNVGAGYSRVTFTNSAFNKGSGNTDNVVGRLYAKSSATFKGCMFRVDYKIVAENGAVLTFEDCICGPPYNQQKLTAENFYKYMASFDSDGHKFTGKVKFSGDERVYSYNDLLKHKTE